MADVVVTIALDIPSPPTLAAGTSKIEETIAVVDISLVISPIPTISAPSVNPYMITASSGAHGSISPSGSIIVTGNGNLQFIMTPTVGYEVDDVTVDGVSVGAIYSYWFTYVSSTHVISVTWKLMSSTPAEEADAGPLYRVDAMRAVIRRMLNSLAQTEVSSAAILQAINDGYKEVSSRAFCIEREDTATTSSGNRMVAFSGHRVNFVQDITSGSSLLRIRPEICGFIDIQTSIPQYWFQWGGYIVIEPIPDAAYPLKLFVSDFPTAELTLTTEFPTSLPAEFHPCIVDFACYVLSLRLRRWKLVASCYNTYINNLQKRRNDYINRKAEEKVVHSLPNTVAYKSNVGG